MILPQWSIFTVLLLLLSQGRTQQSPQVDLEELITNRLLSAYRQFIETRIPNFHGQTYGNLAQGIRNLVLSLDLGSITCQSNPAINVNNWKVNPQADLSVFGALDPTLDAQDLSPSLVNNVWNQVNDKSPCDNKNTPPLPGIVNQELCMKNPTLPQCASPKENFGGTRIVPASMSPGYEPANINSPYPSDQPDQGVPYISPPTDLTDGDWQAVLPPEPVDENGSPITPIHPAFCEVYPKDCKRKEYPIRHIPKYCKTNKDLPECKVDGKRGMLSITSPNCDLFPLIPSCNSDFNPARQLLCLRFPQLPACKMKMKNNQMPFPRMPGLYQMSGLQQMPGFSVYSSKSTNMGLPSHMWPNFARPVNVLHTSMMLYPHSIMFNPKSKRDCFKLPTGPHCAPLLYPGSPLCNKFNWLPICIPPGQPNYNSRPSYYPKKQPINPFLIHYCNKNPSMPQCDTQNIINNLTPDQRLPLILHICHKFPHLQPCKDLRAGRYCDQFPMLEYCQNSQPKDNPDFVGSSVAPTLPNSSPGVSSPTLMPSMPPTGPQNPQTISEVAPTMMSSLTTPTLGPENPNYLSNNMAPGDQPQVTLTTINFDEPSTIPFANNRSPGMPAEIGVTMPGQEGNSLLPMDMQSQPGNGIVPNPTGVPVGDTTIGNEAGNPNMPGGVSMPGGNSIMPGETTLPGGSSFMPGETTIPGDNPMGPRGTTMPMGNPMAGDTTSPFMPDGSSIMPGENSMMPGGSSMMPDGNSMMPGDTTETSVMPGQTGGTTITGQSTIPTGDSDSTNTAVETGSTIPENTGETGSTWSGDTAGTTPDMKTKYSTGSGDTENTDKLEKKETDKKGKDGTTPMPGKKGGSRIIGNKPPCKPGYCQQDYQIGSSCFHKVPCRGQGLPPECSQFPYLSKCRVSDHAMYPHIGWSDIPPYGEESPNLFHSGTKRTSPDQKMQLPPKADPSTGIFGPTAVLPEHRPFNSNYPNEYNPVEPSAIAPYNQGGYSPNGYGQPPGYDVNSLGGYNPIGYGPTSPDGYNPSGAGGYNPLVYGQPTSAGFNGYNPSGYGQRPKDLSKISPSESSPGSPNKYNPNAHGGYNSAGHGPASPDGYNPNSLDGLNPTGYDPNHPNKADRSGPFEENGNHLPYPLGSDSTNNHPDDFGYLNNGLDGMSPNGKGRSPNGPGQLPSGQGQLPNGQDNLPNGQGYLPNRQDYLPGGQDNLPDGQGYLLNGEPTMPGGQGNLPNGQGNLPGGQGFLPNGQDNLPGGQGYLPKGERNIPGKQSNLPNGQGNLPGGQGYLPNGQGNLPDEQGYLPNGERNIPGGQGNLPNGQGNLPDGQGFLPNGERNIPGGQGNLPNGQGNLPGGQGYLPNGQGNLPDGQGYLPNGERNIPGGQGNLPNGQGNLPGGPGYLPNGQGYLPDGQGYLPNGERNIPGVQGNLPNGQGNLPGEQGYLPNGQGYLPGRQGYLPNGERNIPGGQGNLPNGQGNLPGGQGYLPNGQGNLPDGQDYLPNGERNIPGGQGNLPNGQGNLPGGQGYLPSGQGNLPDGPGYLPNGQGYTPNGQGRLPKGQGRLPNGQGYSPNGQGRSPNGQDRLPNGQGRLPYGKGDYGPDNLGGFEPDGKRGYAPLNSPSHFPNRKGDKNRNVFPIGTYIIDEPPEFGSQGYDSAALAPIDYGLPTYDVNAYDPYSYPSRDYMHDQFSTSPQIEYHDIPHTPGFGHSYENLPYLDRKHTTKPGKGKRIIDGGPPVPGVGDDLGVWVGPKGIGDNPGISTNVDGTKNKPGDYQFITPSPDGKLRIPTKGGRGWYELWYNPGNSEKDNWVLVWNNKEMRGEWKKKK